MNQFSDKALQDEKFLFKGSLVPQMSEQNEEINDLEFLGLFESRIRILKEYLEQKLPLDLDKFLHKR